MPHTGGTAVHDRRIESAREIVIKQRVIIVRRSRRVFPDRHRRYVVAEAAEAVGRRMQAAGRGADPSDDDLTATVREPADPAGKSWTVIWVSLPTVKHGPVGGPGHGDTVMPLPPTDT